MLCAFFYYEAAITAPSFLETRDKLKPISARILYEIDAQFFVFKAYNAHFPVFAAQFLKVIGNKTVKELASTEIVRLSSVAQPCKL